MAPPTFEGWVLEAPSGERHKLVQTAFKRAGAAAQQLLHPLVLWDAVRCGGASRQQLAAGLPGHMQRELQSELDALEHQFCSVVRQLAKALTLRGKKQGRGQGESEQQLESLLASLDLEDSSATAASTGALPACPIPTTPAAPAAPAACCLLAWHALL